MCDKWVHTPPGMRWLCYWCATILMLLWQSNRSISVCWFIRRGYIVYAINAMRLAIQIPKSAWWRVSQQAVYSFPGIEPRECHKGILRISRRCGVAISAVWEIICLCTVSLSLSLNPLIATWTRQIKELYIYNILTESSFFLLFYCVYTSLDALLIACAKLCIMVCVCFCLCSANKINGGIKGSLSASN